MYVPSLMRVVMTLFSIEDNLSIIGNVTFESCAYVARYIMKKITGNKAQSHYEIIDKSTGNITSRIPEYTNMSRNPAIGKTFYEKYKSDMYQEGTNGTAIIRNGIKKV